MMYTLESRPSIDQPRPDAPSVEEQLADIGEDFQVDTSQSNPFEKEFTPNAEDYLE